MSDYANDYRHPADSNLRSLHKAMEYNNLGQPIIRTAATAQYSTTGNTNTGTVPLGETANISAGLAFSAISRH